jgi:hypothetical protein
VEDYFTGIIDVLEQLERSIFNINDLKREFDYEVNKKINRQALIAAIVFPMILTSVYVVEGSGLVGNAVLTMQPSVAFLRMFGAGFIAWTMGVALNFFFKYIWLHDYLPSGQAAKQKAMLSRYKLRKNKLESDAELIVSHRGLRHIDIPKGYMNIHMMSLLVDYIHQGKAKTLKEAVDIHHSDINFSVLSAEGESILDRLDIAKMGKLTKQK